MRIDCKRQKNWLIRRHTDGHKNKEKKLKKPTLSLVNAGLRNRVSVLSTKCGGCHPKRLIVARAHKIKQIIITLKFICTKASFPFC